MKCLRYTLLIPILFSGLLHAQHRKAQLEKLMAEAGIPGLSLAYIRDGKIAESYALGVRSTDTNQPVDDETVFAAASLSKCVFAYGVMHLVDAGKLDLDKPLYQYYAYPDLAHDERYKQVTARMVLSHTSGLPNWRNGDRLEFQYDPGQRFRYSGEGFVLLMRTVEKITGQNIEDWMQQTVFKPLGMTHTSYIWQSAYEEDFAVPHTSTGRTSSKYRPEEGNSAHSLQTTATDYGRFVAALLNGQGLKKTTRTQMFTPQAHSQLKEGSDTLQWCLGVGYQLTGAGKAVWQWGDNGTFKAFLIGYPDKQEGLVYLTNSSTGLNIAADLLALFFTGPQPSIDYIDYGTTRDPGLALLKRALEMPFAEAVRPYLDKSGKMQDTVQLTAGKMNDVGYQLLYRRELDAASHAFEMNLKAYPKSRPAMIGLAESSLRMGKRETAVKYLEAAMALKPDDEFGQRVLDRLKGNPDPAPEGSVKVDFTLRSYESARFVTVAGSFNGWNDLDLPMQWVNGEWRASLNLAPGEYRYKFVVDGVWIPDPGNPEIDLKDNFNSILSVESTK